MKELDDYDFTYTKSTQFWIYVITKKHWKEILGSPEDETNDIVYLSSFYKFNIMRGDIVFVYISDIGKSLGFTTCIKIKNNMVKNIKNLRVYKDKNMTNYIVQILSYFHFDNNMSLCKLNTTLLHKTKLYISMRHFKKNYVTGNANFNKLPYKLGKKLYSVLGQFDSINSTISKDISKKIINDKENDYILNKIIEKYGESDSSSEDEDIGSPEESNYSNNSSSESDISA